MHLNYQEMTTEDGAKVAINPNAVAYVAEIDDENTKVVFSDPNISDVYVKGAYGKTKSKLTTKYA